MTTATSTHHTPSFLGSLAQFESYDLTPVIGTLFSNASTTQLSVILDAPEEEKNKLIRDLAVLVSHRGVVFFKNQEDLSVEEQKELGIKLGELSWGIGNIDKKTSGLHVHPISEDVPELGKQVSVISSEKGISRTGYVPQARASEGWHSDITFENVPSDYAMMIIVNLKHGDTKKWASGYEAYDRLSPPFQKLLEGLTATHDGTMFHEYSRAHGVRVNEGPRGAPENIGTNLIAVQYVQQKYPSAHPRDLQPHFNVCSPVIRTNPVTGFKTLFINKGFTTKINELTPDESAHLLDYLTRQFSDNHDLQVRYRWEKNDVAIWDNRVTVHSATNDYTARREGNRIVSLGERPYFDPQSKSRREALGI
ncbi:Putative alpha-ketoglutarate-dependent sulfonate dioxygenase [Leucoagaricus sp. SymC.cos]|nr:Putative alpha-ketoglutarate-dependent sulfonate dioxygenase [Leucoagaricus sp. SymC.cos]